VPLDPEARVFESNSALPIAGTPGVPWVRSGTDFIGEPVEGRVGIAVEFSEGWNPDGTESGWSVSVDGSEGRATFASTGAGTPLAYAVAGLVLVSMVFIVVGRRRR
jgi:hypothetical protein